MGSRLSYPSVELAGKVALVTGGNTGIGYETAKALAAMGAHTIIACRSQEKATAALERMKQEVQLEQAGRDIEVDSMQVDLSSFRSTRDFVDAFKARGLPLHLLINNAGLAWLPELTLTSDKHENVFQVNHLSPFLLTLELLPTLLETAATSGDCRIVFISSVAHTRGVWDPHNLNGQISYGAFSFYQNSKLHNVMTAYSLQRRLTDSGITVSSLHPGVINSELYRHVGEASTVIGFFAKMSKPLMRTVKDGAATTINCAVNPDLNTQQCFYYSDCRPKEPIPIARNQTYQEELWGISIEAVKGYLSAEILEKYRATQTEPSQTEPSQTEPSQTEPTSSTVGEDTGQSNPSQSDASKEDPAGASKVDQSDVNMGANNASNGDHSEEGKGN